MAGRHENVEERIFNPGQLKKLEAAGVRRPTPHELFKIRATYADAQAIIPLKSSILQPEVHHQYVQTQFGLRADLAECYHEQSKLHEGRHDLAKLQVSREAHEAVFLALPYCGFLDFVPARGDVENGFHDLVRHFPPYVRDLIATIEDHPQELHSADLYLLLPRERFWGLYRFHFCDDALNLIRAVPTGHALDLASSAIRFEKPWGVEGSEDASHPPFLAFVVGAIGRSFLSGADRGYRLMMMEAGVLGSTLARWGANNGYSAQASGLFFDDTVNDFLKLDGLTKGALAAVAFTPRGRAPRPGGAN